MEHIDENRLETDLNYRFQYLTKFMGMNETDVTAIHGAATFLAPKVEALVDAVYNKLQAYDSTWRHFVPRQNGYTGEIPTDVAALTQSHPQIKFRKEHLGRYLTALVTKPYDAKMTQYLDVVGKIHTPKAGSPQLNVPLVQMNALMGFVSDALLATIMAADLSKETQVATVRAFNKLLWVQNDLITRHYAQ